MTGDSQGFPSLFNPLPQYHRRFGIGSLNFSFKQSQESIRRINVAQYLNELPRIGSIKLRAIEYSAHGLVLSCGEQLVGQQSLSVNPCT